MRYSNVLLTTFFLGVGMSLQAGNLSLTVSSRSFKAGSSIPAKYSYKGGNISPHLAWTKGPQGTQSYAIICDDPDAPRSEPWVHWVLYNIPADVTEFSEGSYQGQQATNDYQQINWGGPNPPSGTHRYYFKVYALSSKLNGLTSTSTKKDLLAAMKGKILAEGSLMGTYAAA
jgi:Raf kinase inhibitor-like YbhB/YbcL family protein